MKPCENCEEEEAVTHDDCLGDVCQGCADEMDACPPVDEREDFHSDV